MIAFTQLRLPTHHSTGWLIPITTLMLVMALIVSEMCTSSFVLAELRHIFGPIASHRRLYQSIPCIRVAGAFLLPQLQEPAVFGQNGASSCADLGRRLRPGACSSFSLRCYCASDTSLYHLFLLRWKVWRCYTIYNKRVWVIIIPLLFTIGGLGLSTSSFVRITCSMNCCSDNWR